MSEVKSGFLYTKEHEWITVEENIVTLGISDYAQQSLGDIVFIELPDIDQMISKDESFGVIESVKAVSDMYTPVTGKVVEVNENLTDSPEIVNEDPYEEGWIIRVEVDSSTDDLQGELEKELMDEDAYRSFLEEE